MISFTGIHRPFDSGFVPRGGDVVLVSRTQLCFPRKLIFRRVKLDSVRDGLLCSGLETPSVLAADKEEAKAVLTLFLKKQGLRKATAARGMSKSELFIDHLVSRLYSVSQSPHLIARELATLEIRDALLPYLESLHKEHGSTLVDVIENFPHLPDAGRPVVPVPSTTECGKRASMKLKAISRVSEAGPSGSLPPHILYLNELGLDLDQIKVITSRFPAFAYYSLDGKIRPLIEFLLDLGVSKSDLPNILVKRPTLCGMSLSENIIPTIAFLETLGVDKRKWAKVITFCPAILTYSRKKVEATVQFLYEAGLTEENIGKVLTSFPSITGYSVEDKLRPTSEYFISLGIDVAVLLQHCPRVMGLSVETSLKPITGFFLENGFSIEEVVTMISRYGALYAKSLKSNLAPKLEFFLAMDYSRQDLVKFPQYFCYSLEERIKPRYKLVRKSGVKLSLCQLLFVNGDKFELLLQKKIEKLQ